MSQQARQRIQPVLILMIIAMLLMTACVIQPISQVTPASDGAADVASESETIEAGEEASDEANNEANNEPTETAPAQGDAPAQDTETESVTGVEPEVATTQDAASDSSVIDPPENASATARFRERGYLIAGVKGDFRPFGYQTVGDGSDGQADVEGIDVDIVRELANRWLGDPNAVEFVVVTSANAVDTLVSGEVDLLAAAMTRRRELEESIDFSQTYFLDGQSLLVRRDSGIQGVGDLDGKMVAVLEGSVAGNPIDDFVIEQNMTIQTETFTSFAPAVDALLNGTVDALTSDSVGLYQFTIDHPELVIIGGRFTTKLYGIGVREGDSSFRELLNFTLQEMKKDRTYDEILAKWLPANDPYDLAIFPGVTVYQSLNDLPATLETPAQSTILQMLTRGRLIAGVKEDFKPFGYRDADGTLIGFDVDIVREFARRWFGDATAIELLTVRSDDRIPRLAAGEMDLVAASMTHKHDRAETIDFSQTYFLDGQSLLVQQVSGIQEVEDLDGKIVAAIEGSTSIDNIRREATRLGISISVAPYNNYIDAVTALNQGNIDALTTDSVALYQFALDNEGLVVVGGRFTREPYGIGVPQGDSSFRELVDYTLQEMKKDGTYDRIYQTWFPFDAPYDVEILPGSANYIGICIYLDCGKPALADDAEEEVPADSEEVAIANTPEPTPTLAPPTEVPTPEPTATPTLRPTPLPTSPPIPDQASVMQRIRDRGYMIAGVKFDFKPFGYLNNSSEIGGEVIGFDIDLIQAMADIWGIDVQFEQVTSGNRIPKLVENQVDIVAASMTHKKDREETIDFSQTYFLDGQSLLVRADSGIQGVADLDDKVVTAIIGSTSIDQIQAYADANDVDIDVFPFAEYPPAIEALKAGGVDALTTDSVALSQFAKDNPELIVVGELFTEEPYGMGLPAGDSYFNNLVNFTLQELRRNGTYDELYLKWFGENSTPYPIELMPGEWPYTFANSPVDLDKPIVSAVEKILTGGRFVAGVKYDFPPFGFLDENNVVRGFDVDIIKEFGKRWLGDENAIELVQVTSSDRILKLQAGQVDIVAASMTHRQERDELIDFSGTYFLDGQSLLVREDSGIQSLEDLAGRVVTAIEGSTSIGNIQEIAQERGIDIDLVPFLEYAPAIEALKNGNVDALTTDSVALLQFAKDNPGLVVVGGRFTEEPYGLGVPNYDDRFGDLVNFTLQEMKIDGTYDRLYEKWFGEDTPYDIELWPGDDYIGVNTVPMLRVPEGNFIRGSQSGFPNEGPVQEVTVNSFYMDEFEVTNRQYHECIDAGICATPRYARSVSYGDYFNSPAFRNHPVVWVTWDDANAFCGFVGKRLPTEAEWEKAARGMEGYTYPWGNDAPTLENQHANFIGIGHIDLKPVGSYPTGLSPYGVHDMAGNAREWVADWYQRDYYSQGETLNPVGPIESVTRVVRGGAWNEQASDLTTTRRKDFLPESFDGSLGFRCVSDVFPPQ
ncbi:MAG: transporter substrate-binding domain-containing protein [Chloroflexota bacterium]